jgi:bacterioferritin-associated ferredoxin
MITILIYYSLIRAIFRSTAVYICICNAVTERAIRTAAAAGACTVEALTFELGVGAGCGACRDAAQAVLNECANAEGRQTSRVILHPRLGSAAA